MPELKKRLYDPNKKFSRRWQRPSSIAYPQIWSTFESPIKNGKTIKFRIQDATEDMHDAILKIFFDHLVPETTWCKAAGVYGDYDAYKVMKNYINNTVFPQKVALVCVLDSDNSVVAFNLTGVYQKDGGSGAWEGYDSCESLQIFFKLYNELERRIVSVYEKYGVDEYLHSYGLCVLPEYRGNKIASELLSARIPLCKATGIKVTSSEFMSVISQKIATKVGFVEDSRVEHEVISRSANVVMPKMNKYIKIISLKIS